MLIVFFHEKLLTLLSFSITPLHLQMFPWASQHIFPSHAHPSTHSLTKLSLFVTSFHGLLIMLSSCDLNIEH